MAKPPKTPDADDLNDNDEGGEHVLEFTPEDDATIEDIANMVVDMMADYNMDCDVHFPMFTMEVELGATAEEIVDGYNDILDQLAEQMDGQEE
mgnify:CR=1 FL=1